MFESLLTAEVWISLATLVALEVVLGIDNIVFISIVAGKLPERKRRLATRIGILGALGGRLLLLVCLSWVMGLTSPLFTVLRHEISGRDLILICGGLFLIAKATWEIYDKVEAAHPATHRTEDSGAAGLVNAVVQIMVLDMIFSLDSVITAVGMVDELWIMVSAVIVAIVAMLIFAVPIGDFVEKRPSIKILALAFLVLIGVLLVAEGTDSHLNKGYVYFAMAFSLGIEMLNMRYRARRARLKAAKSVIPRRG